MQRYKMKVTIDFDANTPEHIRQSVMRIARVSLIRSLSVVTIGPLVYGTYIGYSGPPIEIEFEAEEDWLRAKAASLVGLSSV